MGPSGLTFKYSLQSWWSLKRECAWLDNTDEYAYFEQNFKEAMSWRKIIQSCKQYTGVSDEYNSFQTGSQYE